MKKISFQSGLVVVYFALIFVFSSVTRAESGLVKGMRAEEIEGTTHQAEYYYGSAAYKDQDSMLKSLSINTYSEDRISVFPDPSYGLGSKIIIQRANPVVVVDAGEEKTYRTWKNSIKDVLDENKVEIGEKDIVSPNKDTKMVDLAGKKVGITRVAETEVKENKDIEYKTITKKDPDMYRGDSRVDQQGKKGIKEYTYLVRRENGKEVSRKLEKTEITKDPIDKVVINGTKVLIYGTGTATWYSLIGGMTAAHNMLPMGTMVHVVNTANGKSVDVKIVDRGIQGGAVIDLSSDAFKLIASLGQGTASVRLEKP